MLHQDGYVSDNSSGIIMRYVVETEELTFSGSAWSIAIDATDPGFKGRALRRVLTTDPIEVLTLRLIAPNAMIPIGNRDVSRRGQCVLDLYAYRHTTVAAAAVIAPVTVSINGATAVAAGTITFAEHATASVQAAFKRIDIAEVVRANNLSLNPGDTITVVIPITTTQYEGEVTLRPLCLAVNEYPGLKLSGSPGNYANV